MSERPSEGFEPFPSPLGEGRRSGRGFRLINQTVMTRAEAPTIDSWVHLAQTLRPPLWGTLFFVLATLGAASAAVFAALRLFGVVRLADEPASDGGLLLGMIAMTAIAVGCGWVARLMVWRWVRNGTVGARPSGVALGAHGVAVRVPGRDVEIPWTEIRGIAPRVRRIGSGMGERELPIIEIARDPDAPVADRVQLIVASGYQVPGDALFTALRWYHGHLDARWELGRVEGERRLEGWRRGALRRQPTGPHRTDAMR